MKIRMEFEPIHFKLLKNHFDLVMDAMLNNVAADDGKDTIFRLAYFPDAKSKRKTKKSMLIYKNPFFVSAFLLFD